MLKEITGFILFVVAIFVSLIAMPISFIYAMFKTNVNNYLFNVALSIDQLGNAVCAPLFNKLFIVEMCYKFGNPDDTVSYVLGRNKQLNNLSKMGKFLDNILNLIDPGHTDMAIQRAIKLKKKENNKNSLMV